MLRGGYQIIDFSGFEISGNADDYTHLTNIYKLINTKKPVLISGLTLISDTYKYVFPDFFAAFVPEMSTPDEVPSYGATVYGNGYRLTITVTPDNTATFYYTSY